MVTYFHENEYSKNILICGCVRISIQAIGAFLFDSFLSQLSEWCSPLDNHAPVNKQSGTQSRLAFWSAGGRPNRLLDSRRHFFQKTWGSSLRVHVWSGCLKLVGWGWGRLIPLLLNAKKTGFFYAIKRVSDRLPVGHLLSCRRLIKEMYI